MMHEVARCRTAVAIVAALGGMAWSLPGAAVTLDGLQGQGLEEIYGSYGPGGNCTREPLMVVDDRGLTFTVAGRTVTQRKVEFAASFMGPQYEGVTQVWFPFPASDDDMGPVLMFMNDDERVGRVRFESNLAQGQRLSAMHAALVAAPLERCAGTAPAVAPAAPSPPAAPAIVAEWTNLPSLKGKYNGEIDFLRSGPIAAALRAQLGTHFDALAANLNVAGALQRQGNVYFLTGNAPHKGGEEQAYVLIDAARRAVQAGLWERGKLTVYGPAGARIALPGDVATMVANSPSEEAVALPGTPWELVEAQGRDPIAYVDAAGSTHYRAFSVLCEGGRPMLAALMAKPLAGQSHTVTWNFNGRLVDVVVSRGNADGTFWQANLAGSPLVGLLASQGGEVLLRLDGKLEGQASLAGSTQTLRTALRSCVRL